jgi:Domain of unknown function (DUF4157)
MSGSGGLVALSHRSPAADPTLVVQRKLSVGAADDPAEREADRCADRVVTALAASLPEPSLVPTDAGRNVAPVGRIARSTRGSVADSAPVADGTASRIRRMTGGGSPMPEPVRRAMEGAFATDFSDVRLHVGAESARLNDELAANAFTTGSDIFLRRSVDTNSTADTRLLAHELTHVVQQGGTNVRRSVSDDHVIRRDDKKGKPKPLQKVDESDHYGHSRDDEHVKGKQQLEAADTDWSISTKLYSHHKPDGKAMTTSIKCGGGFIVVCTFADKSTGRLTYHTAYLSKTVASSGIPNTTYWQPANLEIAS